MTDVYVDVGAASIGTGTSWAPEPESVRALQYLSEAGVRIVLVRTGLAEPGDELRALAADVVRAVPDRPRGLSWYLTSDIARCRGSSARLRTVLIGGAPPNGSVRRCDAVARDVQAAALEILAADAMAPSRP